MVISLRLLIHGEVEKKSELGLQLRPDQYPDRKISRKVKKPDKVGTNYPSPRGTVAGNAAGCFKADYFHRG